MTGPCPGDLQVEEPKSHASPGGVTVHKEGIAVPVLAGLCHGEAKSEGPKMTLLVGVEPGKMLL